MTKSEYIEISSGIPCLPGIYKYFDKNEVLIYVGKAKHLKKRISSYFNKNIPNQKTIELVKKIYRIEYTIVELSLRFTAKAKSLVSPKMSEYLQKTKLLMLSKKCNSIIVSFARTHTCTAMWMIALKFF